jgi:hypothetical protein
LPSSDRALVASVCRFAGRFPTFALWFAKKRFHRSKLATQSANQTNPTAMAVKTNIAPIELSGGAGFIA